MKFFHAHANARRCKNHIRELHHEGRNCTTEEEIAQVTFSYFDGMMGAPACRSNSINMSLLDLPRLNLQELDEQIIEEEV
jgi:hypothetical protein